MKDGSNGDDDGARRRLKWKEAIHAQTSVRELESSAGKKGHGQQQPPHEQHRHHHGHHHHHPNPSKVASSSSSSSTQGDPPSPPSHLHSTHAIAVATARRAAAEGTPLQ